MSIDTYLTHLVDVVTVTISKGERTEVTVEDIPCRITSRREIIRDARGDRLYRLRPGRGCQGSVSDGEDPAERWVQAASGRRPVCACRNLHVVIFAKNDFVAGV